MIRRRAFAENIGLFDLVSERAKDEIENILFKNVIDVATSANSINTMKHSLESLNNELLSLSGLYKFFETEPLEYEEALIHIRFQRDASINNIVDLKEWGTAWFDIGRGITIANNVPPEEFRVIGASRGSLVIDFAVGYGVAKTLISIILQILKVTERALDIRKKAEELRGLKLTNAKIAKDIEKEAKKVEDDGQAHVLELINSDMKIEGDQEAALKNAISKIFIFISKGGEIDVYMEDENETKEDEESDPTANENQKVIDEIRESFKEIKHIEKKSLNDYG